MVVNLPWLRHGHYNADVVAIGGIEVAAAMKSGGFQDILGLVVSSLEMRALEPPPRMTVTIVRGG